MSHRILMIGGANYTDTIVHTFASHLKACADYRVSALGFGGGAGHPGEHSNHVFDETHAFPTVHGRPSRLLGRCRMVADATKKFLPMTKCRNLPAGKNSFKQRVARRLLLRTYARDIPRLTDGYDLYHWHCFEPERLLAIPYLPEDAKVIFTMWGSDLMRVSGVDANRIQLAAAERATYITMGSVELREIFLARFGRHLTKKIRLATYGAGNLSVCDKAVGTRDEFLKRHGLSPSTKTLCVGNSASRGNRHIPIIHELGKLPTKFLEQLSVIVPMTYGADSDYVREVRDALRRLEVQSCVMDTVLSENEVGQLRNATDILIHLPVSDQFSAAMCESLYTGAILLTGAWLPYSRLRCNNIHYHEVLDINEIPIILGHIIKNLPLEKCSISDVKLKIREIISWDSAIVGWHRIYEELLAK